MSENQHTALICLGGNAPQARCELDMARSVLCQSGSVMSSSGLYITQPEYAGESEPYVNELIHFSTSLPFETLRATLKEYETQRRSLNTHSPLVNIDIDIVIFDNEVMRPRDANAKYFQAGLQKIKCVF